MLHILNSELIYEPKSGTTGQNPPNKRKKGLKALFVNVIDQENTVHKRYYPLAFGYMTVTAASMEQILNLAMPKS